MSARLRKRGLPEQLSEERKINLPELKALFRKSVLRRPLKMPGDNELLELVRILNHWRGEFISEQQRKPSEDIKSKALKAINTADDAFSQLGIAADTFFMAATRERAPAWICVHLAKRQREITEARQIVQALRTFSFLQPGGWGADRGWQWLAGVLSQDFYNTMAPRNPNLRPGISTNGPLVRFMTAAVPLISGQSPTAASVAVQLKTLKKNGNISIDKNYRVI